MKYLVSLILAAVFSSAAFSQSEVKIGKQVWITKNLDVITFRNGEAIPEAMNEEEWEKAGKNKTAAFCYYEYDSKYGNVYGKLYNWYAVKDSRGLAPKGYHVPSDAEWTVLIDFLGGTDQTNAGHKMKSTTGWRNIGGNGDNSSGFNGIPGGFCNSDGDFWDVTTNGGFWSFSKYDANSAWYCLLGNTNFVSGVFRYRNYKDHGMSVRCIKD